MSAACVICLDSSADDAAFASLPCGHVFHSDCVINWHDKTTSHIAYGAECPTCRKSFHKQGIRKIYLPTLSVNSNKKSNSNPQCSKTQLNTKTKSSKFRLFVKFWDKKVCEKDLETLLKPFIQGNLDVRLCKHLNGNCKGFGFILLDKQTDANSIIQRFNGTFWRGNPLHIEFAKQNNRKNKQIKSNKIIFVKNINGNVDEDDVKELFNEFGPITNIKLFHYKKRQTARIVYQNSQSARDAIKNLNEILIWGNFIRVEFCKNNLELNNEHETTISTTTASSSSFVQQNSYQCERDERSDCSPDFFDDNLYFDNEYNSDSSWDGMEFYCDGMDYWTNFDFD